MISVSFDYSIDDALAFDKQCYEDLVVVKKSKRITMVMDPVGVAIVGLLFFWQFGLAFGVSATIVTAIWIASYRLFLRWQAERNARNILKDSGADKQFGRFTVQFTDDGIESTSPLGEGKYKWDIVDRVILTPNHLFIFLGGAKGFPINRREVSDSKVSEIQAYVTARMHTEREPGEVVNSK